MLVTWVEPLTGNEKYEDTFPIDVLVTLTGRKLPGLRKMALLSFLVGAKPGANMIHDR
jgi:hypothetical protein